MIRVEDLSRRYGDVLAVDGVSFEVSRGEVVGLLGHNGAGKTTIMKMLTGYLEPSSGRIIIDGIDPVLNRGEAQKKIGYLPENCPLYPEMTVIGYLDYQAALHGVPAAGREAAVAEAIRRTALGAKATAPIHTLSRGYRQRVGVAQAILHKPDVVILDEPTNGLDPTQIRQMRSLIRELAEHATVIVSTHILQEVQAVADRVLIINAGRLAVDARLDELAGSGRLEVVVDAGPERLREALAGVAGVGEIVAGGVTDGHYRYALQLLSDEDESAAPLVARTLTDAGFALYSLAPQVRDLEAVFREVEEKEVAHG